MEPVPNNKPYPRELRDRAVAMVLEWRRERGRADGGLNEVGEKLGVHPESIRNWVNRHQTDAGERPGTQRRRAGQDEGARAREPGAQASERDPASGLGIFRPGGARPPTEVIVGFIDENKEELGVEPICKVLQVATSTYYAAKARAPSARALRDALLVPALVAIWSANFRVYGVRKLWRAAQRAGYDLGRDQVARLMDVAGIEGLRRGKKRKTTKPDPGATRHPDLVERAFGAEAPNRLWVTDLTYVATWSGFAYV